MPDYIVKEPLRYNGKHYPPGARVEMAAKEAGELLALGVLSPGTEAAPGRPNSNTAIAQVKAAETLEALTELAAGEDRKSVLAAIEARRQELGA